MYTKQLEVRKLVRVGFVYLCRVLYFTKWFVFCIKLLFILGYKGTFRWIDYLKEQKAVAAPVRLFQKVCKTLCNSHMGIINLDGQLVKGYDSLWTS